MDEASCTNVFPYAIMDLVMIGSEYEFLTKFLKMKHPSLHSVENIDAFEFIIDYYEGLHKLEIVQ